MDTSKEYILMCEKAVEIQEARIKQRGDYYFHVTNLYILESVDPRDKQMLYIINLGYADDRSVEFTEPTWLPRQDQLQEILEATYDLVNLFIAFTDWAKGTLAGEHGNRYKESELEGKFNSMEQLWLAFVMSEKFNKVWNGKEWVSDGH
jgi:hypothetical protein